jgi:hypothetical protein
VAVGDYKIEDAFSIDEIDNMVSKVDYDFYHESRKNI